jgi:hypothetical protein
MSKYLSETGLSYLWDKIKAFVNTKQNQIKAKTAAEWSNSSDVPESGEIIVVKDASGIKIGNGTNTTSELEYVGGLMTAADKTKLNGIAAEANKYVHPSYTAVVGKPSANISPAFGGAATISQIVSDSTGHITGANDVTITIPDAVATQSTAGLMSAADKTKLDGIISSGAVIPGNATTTESGLMSAEDKTKLDGIENNAEVNQNAFSSIVVGNDTIGAAAATDALTVSAGNNVTLTPDTTNRSLVISAADTTYGAATTSAAGLMSAADKTKLDGIASGAQVNPGAATTSSSGLMSAADKTKLDGIASGAQVNQNSFSSIVVGSTTIESASATGSLTIVAGNNITLTPNATSKSLTIAATDTTYSAATTSAAGLMSAADKTKLNGIAAGAQVHIAPTAAEVKSALGTGSGTSKYLREDGTWVVPAGTYSLPLAASGTRGGVQIGYTANGKNYPVQLSSEKMYVNVPWSDTNTWRPVQNNLTSDSTSDCLSAYQGKVLKDALDKIFTVYVTLTFSAGYVWYANTNITGSSKVFAVSNTGNGGAGMVFSMAPGNGGVGITVVATNNVTGTTNWSGTKNVYLLIDNR